MRGFLHGSHTEVTCQGSFVALMVEAANLLVAEWVCWPSLKHPRDGCLNFRYLLDAFVQARKSCALDLPVIHRAPTRHELRAVSVSSEIKSNASVGS
ncbi:hypothetical protein PAXRUDRAFT_694725 [Paxillus rubicundulus Ve08.2h10]|uniref:Uncharacterized protein n=1 Tax=Paxillus rubicundulus Ve08.2h10 TaxID=930991 RepID=A0A0D0D9E9_9AGAM|nr:hypothetical protein PAXRUDRAFT_694725 [Paxillus rubicundulus Ve08.2h10]